MLPEKNGITYASSDALSRHGGIVHAFAGRKGGVSAPPFSSLNLSLRVGDDPERVAENRERSAHAFGYREAHLVTVDQVHSDTVLVLENRGCDYSRKKADAIISHRKWEPIGVLTADCVPILLYDPVNGVAAAVHAGWRGTVKGIAGNTVKAMTSEYGSDPASVVSAIGPSIGRCCYAVSSDVAGEFKKRYGSGRGSPVDPATGHVDLVRANILDMERAGLAAANMSVEKSCTSCRSDAFFSHRKDNGKTGRQLSFIMMKGKT